MNKLVLVISIFVLNVSLVYAGGVTDDNNGNLGDIFVSTGENNGANSVGTWTDPSFLKGEKGDKGDTGATGATGSQGDKGDTGNNGINGVNGENGEKGETGAKGDVGATGKGLKDAYEVQFEGVIKEGSRNAFSVYGIHDFNNNIDTVGLKWKHYFGKSYSEQVREDLQKQIDELKGVKSETSIPANAEMYMDGTSIGIREKF